MHNIEAMLGSLEDAEYRNALREAAIFEMFLARTYTRSYVAGLELGTRLVDPEFTGAIDEYDGGAGRYGLENMPRNQLRYSVLGEELLSEEGDYAIVALQAGIRAGREHPLRQLEEQGVAA